MKTNAKFLKTTFMMLLASFIMLSISCSKDEKNQPVTGATAKISGTVITPSGKTVPVATIASGLSSTKSDKEGHFELELPAGTHKIFIYTGGGRVFKTVLTVNLAEGENLVLPVAQTVLEQVVDLAYIEGDYDKIETLIMDSLGYNATMIQVSDLQNLNNFSQYGALFLNCGLLNTADMDATAYANLLDYLVTYGSIYASDFAVECFTGDGNLRLAGGPATCTHTSADQTTTACINPLLGGFIPDSSLCTQKNGTTGMCYDAVILDPNLVVATGNDSLNLIYDLAGWEMVNSFDAPFTPIITHATYGALALKADLVPENGHGEIYFTTFHNNPQGVSNEVEAILNYIILNL